LELKTGERAEGICFAMQTFINKIGMAIGAFIGVLAYYG
jgi:Na+/melibiose symporter-like transporter